MTLSQLMPTLSSSCPLVGTCASTCFTCTDELPAAPSAAAVGYLGIVVAKSGYCFCTVVLLTLYSGVSNCVKGGAFSFSNLDFTSSFVRDTQRWSPSYPSM